MNNFNNDNKSTLIIKDTACKGKNFSGARSRGGERTFCVTLDDGLAERLAQDGWNVKLSKVYKEGDTPYYFLPIEASYDKWPPTVVMLRKGRPKVYMTENTISELDGLTIEKISVNVRPSVWINGAGERKVKAYLKSAIVTVEVDELLATLAEEEAPEEE